MEWSQAAQHLATVLSTLTILSCFFLKVPQITHVRRTRSTEGLNMRAMIMEICSYTITGLYQYTSNHAALTYMEYPIIVVQVLVLLYYVLRHKNKLYSPMVITCAVAYVIMTTGFITKVLNPTILSYVVPISTPMSAFAKLTYIYGIIMDRNADAVSLVTWVISIVTNMARIYTVCMDSMDTKMIVNYTSSSILSSGVLITAMIYQWTKPDPPSKYDPTDLPRSRRKSTHRD